MMHMAFPAPSSGCRPPLPALRAGLALERSKAPLRLHCSAVSLARSLVSTMFLGGGVGLHGDVDNSGIPAV